MTQIGVWLARACGVASPTRNSAAMSPRRLGWLFFPQPRLAQAFHMQLVHPLVAEAVLPKERERSVGLVLEELGDLGLRLIDAAKLGEGYGDILAGGIVLRSERQRPLPAWTDSSKRRAR